MRAQILPTTLSQFYQFTPFCTKIFWDLVIILFILIILLDFHQLSRVNFKFGILKFSQWTCVLPSNLFLECFYFNYRFQSRRYRLQNLLQYWFLNRRNMGDPKRNPGSYINIIKLRNFSFPLHIKFSASHIRHNSRHCRSVNIFGIGNSSRSNRFSWVKTILMVNYNVELIQVRHNLIVYCRFYYFGHCTRNSDRSIIINNLFISLFEYDDYFTYFK